jgi:hypothetical protein
MLSSSPHADRTSLRGQRLRTCSPRSMKSWREKPEVLSRTAEDGGGKHPRVSSLKIISLRCYSREFSSFNGPACARRIVTLQNSRSSIIPIKFGTFLTTFTPYTSLATTSTFDHGSRVPTTQGTGRYYLGVEQSHRSRKFREGFEFPTSQGRIWHRQRSSYTDQGMFSALLERSAQAHTLLGRADG